MLYLEQNRTGLVWTSVVWAWTLANIVFKIKKHSNLVGGCTDISVWTDPSFAPPVTYNV